MLVIALLAISFVAGVIITLHQIGKRPITINVSAKAESYGGGGSAGTNVSPGSGGVGGFFQGLFRLMKLTVILGFLALVFMTISNLSTRVPQQAPTIIVNVPTSIPQEIPAPKIVVTIQPPVVNVPQAQPPVVHVSSTPSILDWIMIPLAILGILVSLFMSYRIWKLTRSEPPTPQWPPAGYIRTDYGWTPGTTNQGQPNGSVDPETVAPGLFSQTTKIPRR